MNDPLEHVRELALSARSEACPRSEVAAKVITRLRRRPVSMTRPLTVFATVTGVLAMVAVLLAVNSLSIQLSDPLSSLFQVAVIVNI